MEKVEASFHARESCVAKRYIYYVHQGRCDPFETRYCWSVMGRTRLDVAKMHEAAAMLVGVHDFTSFGVIDEVRRTRASRWHPRARGVRVKLRPL